MENQKIKISFTEAQNFLNEDGTYDIQGALIAGGHFAGECYDEEGYEHIIQEPLEKTQKRMQRNLDNHHFSVYGHTHVTLNIENIPKILAMIINNEKEYNTSEKSARYTKIDSSNDINISDREAELYVKWFNIFKEIIDNDYSGVFNESKRRTLAQENARYCVTVFMSTKMIYTTSLRQLNQLAAWMKYYIDACSLCNTGFETKISEYMNQFVAELERLNLLCPQLMVNDKCRTLSLISMGLSNQPEYFGDCYSTYYKGSFAQLAQAQRHRTLDYKMELLPEAEFFIPPILEGKTILIKEWLNDIHSVKAVHPQGELVGIRERGTYDNFILKCKERLCTGAQLEIMMQTRNTLLKYQKALVNTNNILAEDIKKYTKGARCTFYDFECPNDCKFKDGKTLKRKI